MVCIIITIWTSIVCRNIENKNLKKYIKILCGLLLFWLIIRTIKYYFVNDNELRKLLWYLYYLPNIFTSTIFMFIGTWHNKNKKYIKVLKIISFIGSSILFLLVLTNDFHRLVFKIDLTNSNWESNYEYGIIYYICFVWIFINILIGIIYSIKESKGLYKKQKFIILSIIFLLVFTYAIGYMKKLDFIFIYFYDFIIIYCICYMLALIIVVYKEKYRMSLEENLYKEIEDSIKDKTILINKLINNISKSKTKKRDLAYIKILVSYCKRKSNLIVIQKNKDYYNSLELKLLIDEALKDAESLGVFGAVNIVNKFEVSIYVTSIIYDYVYNLFEYSNNYKNSNILISIEKVSNFININTAINIEDTIVPLKYNYEMSKYIDNKNILEEQIINDDSLNISLKIPTDIIIMEKKVLSEKENTALLQIKSKVHDILGQRLSVLSYIIEEDKIDIEKINEIKPLLNNILEDLNSDKQIEPSEMLFKLTYTCKLAGTNLFVIGNLPKNYLKAITIVKIIRECSTNAIRHAKAKNIYVTIHEGKQIELDISNDGKIPVSFNEGDGIRGIKMRVKELNGDIQICTKEKFTVKIKI